MLVTVPAVTVHEIDIPDSEPQELTLAVAPTTFCELAAVPLATALLGTASKAPTATLSAGGRRISA